MIVKILKISLIVLGVLIIQGCSNKEPTITYKDRVVEKVVTKNCKIPTIMLCNIPKEDSYTNIIDNMDLCIQELIGIINICKKVENE